MTDQEREQILKMIEDGKISPEEGLKLMRVLEQSAAEQAKPAPKVETAEGAESHRETSGMAIDPRIAHIKSTAQRLWQIPLWIGVVIVVLSALGMYSQVQGGSMNFWFYCLTLPLLLLGVIVIAAAVGSRKARWLFVDVNQKSGDHPQRIFLGFPLPLKPAAWFLRTFGAKIDNLKKTNVDEVIQIIETGFTGDEPLVVNVDEGEDGEKVKVYIG